MVRLSCTLNPLSLKVSGNSLSLGLLQKAEQLGDIRCNPTRLTFAEQLGGRASSRLICNRTYASF
jgi:hypothetical protein